MTKHAYPARVVACHDGDTLTALLDLGFNLTLQMPVRLLGINARELAMPGGVEARDALAALLPPGTRIWVDSVSWDKYGGRIDGLVSLVDGQQLAELLIATGWAARWDGKGKAPTPIWPRASSTTGDPSNESVTTEESR